MRAKACHCELGRTLRQQPAQVAISLAILHIAVALAYKYLAHLGITNTPRYSTWDAFWQTIPLSLLSEHFWQSLLYFHAQPPLFNVYGYLLFLAGGDKMFALMHYVQILLGGLTVAMVYLAFYRVSKRPYLSFIGGLLFALHPAYFVYEAFLLYTIIVAFLVSGIIYTFVAFQKHQTIHWLIGSVALTTALILTRSLYHLVLLVPVIGLGLILAKQRWRSYLIGALLISSLAIGWSAKNYALFGFFGSSSWLGSSMWRITTYDYTHAHLLKLYRHGLIDRAAVAIPYFARPSQFQAYGFVQTSAIPVLAGDNYNNINMIAISQMHMTNAVRLICYDLSHYLSNVHSAYQKFCLLSTSTSLVAGQNDKILNPHKGLANRLFGGGIYCLLIPGVLLVFTYQSIRNISRYGWREFIESQAPVIVGAIFLSYVALVSSCCEYGENCRFKLPVEAVVWLILLAILPRPNKQLAPR